MNKIFKQTLKEMVGNVDFPLFIFNYETKRIITANFRARAIIGKEIRSVKDLFLNREEIKYSEELLKDGSKIFYQVNYFDGTNNILVDEEVNVITIDEVHICIVFFEYSYKHIFDSCLNVLVPRIFWSCKEKNYLGRNGFAKKEISKEAWIRFLKENESIDNGIKMILSHKNREFFIQFRQIEIIDKYGEVFGKLGIYHRILGREESVTIYEDAMKEMALTYGKQVEELEAQLMELERGLEKNS